MPLYEYQCKHCHQRLEKIQTFSAPPEKVCPKCGGQLERLISAPAFQFKGAGWYVTDYAKSGGAAKTESGGETAAKSDGKSDAPTESKPASSSTGESSAPAVSPAPATSNSSSSPSKSD